MANPKKELDINPTRLQELGFDPAAPIPEQIAKLRALRGNCDASDLAIAKALGEINDAAAGELLVEMEAQRDRRAAA